MDTFENGDLRWGGDSIGENLGIFCVLKIVVDTTEVSLGYLGSIFPSLSVNERRLIN